MDTQTHDAIQELIVRIFRLDDALKAVANRISRPAGQTGARWQVLNALDDGPKTVAEIARLKNSSRQGVQRIAKELVEDGATAIKANPKHRRYPLVCLTPQGEAALRAIRSERQRWTAEISAALGGEIDPAVLRFLDRFHAAIETTLLNR
jgi:DNA-binding MarR family transcriptional regulator